jgi:integrase/recombinase XerD
MKNSYKRNPSEERGIAPFIIFLQQKNYHPDSIRMYANYAGYFLGWLSKENKTADGARYEDVLSFVSACQSDGRNAKHINLMLTAIRHYYDHLQQANEYKHKHINNPAQGVHIKGATHRIAHDLLDKEALEILYQCYPKGHGQAYNLRTQRNKVIVGLYVYQGISTGSLDRLKPEYINFRAGTIYIPSAKDTQSKQGLRSRILSLDARQVVDLKEYIDKTRPALLEAIVTGAIYKRAVRKPNRIDCQKLSEQLFFSLNGSSSVKSSIKHITQELTLLNAKVKEAVQLRKSVIVEWLKTDDIRMVQYKAGHGTISATERYRQADTKELSGAIAQFHPLQ